MKVSLHVSIVALNFFQKMIDAIRPQAPLRAWQEVQVRNGVRIALVHVDGEIPRRGGAYDHGYNVAIQTPREDAMVFDLRSLALERAPGKCDMFFTGLWSGTNHARCHSVLNDEWMNELLQGFYPPRRVYSDVESAIAAAAADERRRRTNLEKHAVLDLTRIILRGGLGPLRFRMTPEQVQAVMGGPDLVENNYWEYEDIDLNLKFKTDRNFGESLVELWTENPRVRLLDISLIGPGLAHTRSLLERVGVKHKSTTVADGIDWQYFDHGLTLHSLGNTVERVEWTIETENPVDLSGEEQIG